MKSKFLLLILFFITTYSNLESKNDFNSELNHWYLEAFDSPPIELEVIKESESCVLISYIENGNTTYKVIARISMWAIPKAAYGLCMTTIKNPAACNAVYAATKALVYINEDEIENGITDGIEWVVRKFSKSSAELKSKNIRDASSIFAVFNEYRKSYKEGKECGVNWGNIELPPSCSSKNAKIKLLCEYYKGRYTGKFYIQNRIPTENIRNAKEAMRIKENVEIIGLLDSYSDFKSSIWGTNHTGMAITDKGIYWKNSCDDCYGFFEWDDLKEGKIAFEDGMVDIQFERRGTTLDGWVRYDESNFISMGDSDMRAYEMAGLIEDIINILK